MKTFKQLIAEVAQPKSEDELNFKDKHEIDFIDHPESEEHQHTAEKKASKRLADYDEGEDEDVYEANLDPVGQEDDDIDNDGDVDDSDEYLRNRRKVIAKAMQKESFGLDESLDMSEIGRRLQKMAPKEKNDIISNAMANLGDHLESFGTSFGAKNMKDLVKKTGLNAHSIQMLIRKASATNESADSPYAIGMASAMKSTGDEPPLKKSTITKAHKIAKGIMKDDEVDESAFIAKAAGAHKAGKKRFKLGDKEFPVTIKKSTADQIDEVSDKLKARYLDKAVQQRYDFFREPWDPKKEPKWATPGGKPKKGYYDQPHKVKAREKDRRRGEIIDKTAMKLTGKPHYSQMSTKTSPAVQGNASDWWKGKKYSTESFDQMNEMKQPFVVIDTANGNKVVAMASDEQDAKRSIASAERPPMRIKDKSTLKIVKTHKKQSIGYPLNEETDLAENFKAGAIKLNDGSSVLVKDQDAKLLNQMFDDLNAANKKRMMKVAMTDKNGFNEILGFAREAL
jgi:hypothetical protein